MTYQSFSMTAALDHFRDEIIARFGNFGIVDGGRMHCAKHEDGNPSAYLFPDDKGFNCFVCGYVDVLELIRVYRPEFDFPTRLGYAKEHAPGSSRKVRAKRDESHGLF